MTKSKLDINKLVVFLPIVTVILTLVFMLFSGVRYYNADGSLLKSFSGFEIIFGTSEVVAKGGVTTTAPILNFSVLALLAALLPLCGALMQLISNKMVKLVALFISLVGIVFMFMLPSFVVFSTQALDTFYSYFVYHIGIGAILGGITLCIQSIIIGYEILR